MSRIWSTAAAFAGWFRISETYFEYTAKVNLKDPDQISRRRNLYFSSGWDKTYCLKQVKAEKEPSGIEYTTIHFFGDKAYKGGNDYEIFEEKRTVGHSVESPDDTMRIPTELFDL